MEGVGRLIDNVNGPLADGHMRDKRRRRRLFLLFKKVLTVPMALLVPLQEKMRLLERKIGEDDLPVQ